MQWLLRLRREERQRASSGRVLPELVELHPSGRIRNEWSGCAAQLLLPFDKLSSNMLGQACCLGASRVQGRAGYFSNGCAPRQQSHHWIVIVEGISSGEVGEKSGHCSKIPEEARSTRGVQLAVRFCPICLCEVGPLVRIIVNKLFLSFGHSRIVETG